MSTALLSLIIFFANLQHSHSAIWRELVHYNFTEIDHYSAFQDWRSVFSKEYTDTLEESHRYSVFLETWTYINDHNLIYESGNSTYNLALNQFSDLTFDEFVYYVNGHGESCLLPKHLPKNYKSSNKTRKVATEDPAVDWTDFNGKNYVTPVKNQGQCGSCWAFSSTGATETQYALAHNQPEPNIVSLSEQELIDCSNVQPYGNLGCNGGRMDKSFQYIKDKNGLCSESEYPYKGVNGPVCKVSDCSKRYSPLSGYTNVYPLAETLLAQAVTTNAVSVAVYSGGAFQSYHSGVLTGNCPSGVNHGVLVVGMGHDTRSGLDYWKVKNSWGTSWGDNGYILICKECGKNGSAGECGIATDPTFPIASKK